MKWEFEDVSNPPPVPKRGHEEFVVLCRNERTGREFVTTANYLNGYPLEMEGCDCAEEHDDGCPTTGWHTVGSSYDYDEQYTRLEGVVAYCALPDAPTARAAIRGPW